MEIRQLKYFLSTIRLRSVKLAAREFYVTQPAISIQLNSAYPAHDYPIMRQEAQRVGLNVKDLDPKLNQMLLDLHGLYSETGQSAVTDFDERNYHNNEVLNIIESVGIQVY